MDTPFGTPSETTDWHFVTPQLPVADLRATQVYDRDVIVDAIVSHPYGMHEFSIEDNNEHRFGIGHSDGPVTPSVGSHSR